MGSSSAWFDAFAEELQKAQSSIMQRPAAELPLFDSP